MAGTIKHRFVNPVPDEGVATETGPDEWNDSEVVAGGSDGQAMVRRTSAPDGWELIWAGAPLIFSSVTHVDNSGTGETDLHSYTLPTAHFNVDKKHIRLRGTLSFAANANVKTVKLKLGATFSLTLNPTQTAPNGLAMNFNIDIIRTGSNAQHVYGYVLLGTAIELQGHATATETDSGALVLKVTGQSGTASSDITMHVSSVEFLN